MLKSAAEARNSLRTSKEVDKKFGEVIDMLSGFEKDFPSKGPTSNPNIGEMVTREAKMGSGYKSPSKILHTLKWNLHAKVRHSTFQVLNLTTLTNVTNPSQWAMNGRN